MIILEETDTLEKELPLEANILRNRTFNAELKNLIGNIKNNELQGSRSEKVTYTQITDGAVNLNDRNAILKKLHELFYKNINYQVALNSSKMPLELTSMGNIREVIDEIKTNLSLNGFNEFAVLVFDFNKRGFIPLINTIDSLVSEDIILSLNDPLKGKIDQSENGLLVKDTQLLEDYGFYVDELNKTYYFYKPDLAKVAYAATHSQLLKTLAPILIVPVSEDKKEKAFNVITHFCYSLLVDLFRLYLENNFLLYSDNYKKNIITVFLDSMPLSPNSELILLNINNQITSELLYIAKYLENKILRYSEASLQIASNKIIISVTKPNLVSLEKDAIEMNDLYENFVKLQKLNPEVINQFMLY